MRSRPIVASHAYQHGLSKQDILHAWRTAYKEHVRHGPYPPQHVMIGPDATGHDIQLVAVWNEEKERWVIFHAMRATNKVRKAPGLL